MFNTCAMNAARNCWRLCWRGILRRSFSVRRSCGHRQTVAIAGDTLAVLAALWEREGEPCAECTRPTFPGWRSRLDGTNSTPAWEAYKQLAKGAHNDAGN